MSADANEQVSRKEGLGAGADVTFKKKGKYPYLCTVPGHAAAGMKGVFTVR